MSSRISVSSTEWERITADPIRDGEPYDPTSDEVELNFAVADAAPVEAEWHTAEWEIAKPPYVARVLVGPDGDVQLPEGRYDVYLRVIDGDEKPSILADRLVVYGSTSTFASVMELADRLGQTIPAEDAGATRALQQATDLIRATLHQTITYVGDDVAELDGTGTEALLLPQLPVIEVSEVVTIDNASEDDEETIADPGSYLLDAHGILWCLPEGDVWLFGHGNVRVTHSHGYLQIPPEAVDLCLSIAARQYLNDSSSGASVTSKQIGSAQVAYGAPSEQVGSRGFTDVEERLLDAYPWPLEPEGS